LKHSHRYLIEDGLGFIAKLKFFSVALWFSVQFHLFRCSRINKFEEKLIFAVQEKLCSRDFMIPG